MKNSYVDWLLENNNPDDLCDPVLEPQTAVNFLCDYLLGEDWYVTMPESTKQVNSAIVDNILYKYSKKYRKEIHDYMRKKNRMKLTYVCKDCGEPNIIEGWWKWFIIPHFGNMKYLKCQHCHSKRHFMHRKDRNWSFIDWPK